MANWEGHGLGAQWLWPIRPPAPPSTNSVHPADTQVCTCRGMWKMSVENVCAVFHVLSLSFNIKSTYRARVASLCQKCSLWIHRIISCAAFISEVYCSFSLIWGVDAAFEKTLAELLAMLLHRKRCFWGCVVAQSYWKAYAIGDNHVFTGRDV